MSLNKFVRRIVSGTLAVMLGIGSFMVNAGASSLEGSNKRINTYIKMAAGKTVTNDDLSGLTEDQLRFLGVYVSNFFVPFGTEFGTSGKDDDTTIQNKEDIKTSLQTQLSFSDTMAESLTDTLLGLTRASVKELSFYVSKGYQSGDYVEVPNFAGNYLNFQRMMLGRADDVLKYYVKSKDTGEVKKGILDGTYKYGYFGYMDGGSFVPIFDCCMDGTKYTASQLAYFKCLESVDIEKGYGWNIMDFTASEEVDEKTFESMKDNISKSDAYKMSIYGTMMAVDCFGNIICMGGNHQYIAVPGCINPYTWQSVDSAGEDNAKPGAIYNIVNVPSLVKSDKKNLFSSVMVSDDNTGGNRKDGETVEGSSTYDFTGSMAGDKLIKAISNKKSLDKGSRAYNALKYVLDYAGGPSVSDSEFTLKLSTDGKTLSVTGTRKNLKEIKASRLSDSYLNSPNRDKDKKNELEKHLKTLKKYGVSDADIRSNLESMEDQITDEINDDSGSETTQGSGTDTIRKTGKFTVKDLESKLEKVECDGSYGSYTLRLNRGEEATEMGVANFLGIKMAKNSSFRDFMEKGMEGFKEANPKDHTYLYATDKIDSWFGDNGEVKSGLFKATATFETAGPTNHSFAGNKNLELVDTMVFIDNLGTYNFDDSENEVEYNAFNVSNFLEGDNKASEMESVDFGSSSFGNQFENIKSGKMEIPESASEQALVSIYITYVWAGLYDDSDKSNTIGRLGWKMAIDTLPDMPSDPLKLSGEAKTDLMLTSIRDWLYYLLHPTDGLNYVRELVTNKLNAFLLGWHNDMVGTYGVGATTGTTYYRSQTGYVTTPDLSEIQWMDSLIGFYNECIPFLVVAMIVTMLFAYVTGVLSLQRSIFGVVIFAVFLLMPVNLINNVVGISNRVSQNLYGEKFTYWALVQHESYGEAIDSAADPGDGGDYGNYLRTLYSENRQVYSNQGSESIVLKWQAPKKMASLMLSQKDSDSLNGLSESGRNILGTMLNNTYSGESFMDDEDALYMFRSYLDISNFSRYIYRGISNDIRASRKSLANNITSNFTPQLKKSLSTVATDYEKDRNKGYTNKDSNGNNVDVTKVNRVIVPLSSRIVGDALAQRGTIDSLTIDKYVGIDQNLFNFSIPIFNTKSGKYVDYLKANTDNATDDEIKAIENAAKKYSEEDFTGLAAYGLYSENVFYYFSWNLYDGGLETSASTSDGYKKLLLGENNAGFFYNTTGNGELKDFMDMKSLFTYVIPYLRQCNDIVREWDDVYGIFYYEGVPTEEGHWSDEGIKDDKEMQQKYWHNLNVARLYGLYTPWVDVMYDCSYAKGELVSAMGEKHDVEDPINPASYPKERPMIFSESEMVDYGLSRGDLTKVERLILDCNKGMQERMYELLNYYSFSDVTLNAGAAINCAFEFNETFSESGFFSDNHNIYPQSFELADFSYDAFLRFILANTTGDDITNQDDFYNTLIQNSSMTTVLVMLLLDIISVYVLPAFRLFFIIAVFLLSILIIVSTAFKIDPEQKFIKKVINGLVVPMIYFFAITIGFSYVISLFMGTGSNAVTQSNHLSIQMGDPVVAMVAMIAVNIASLILYYKVLRGVINSIKSHSKSVFSFVSGVFGGAVGGLAGAVAGGGGSRGFGGGGSPHTSYAEKGTGVASSRAVERGSSKNVPEYDDRKPRNDDSTRQNDAKRDTIKSDYKKKSDDSRDKRRTESINNRTTEGMGRLNKGDSKKASKSFTPKNRVKDTGSKPRKDK